MGTIPKQREIIDRREIIARLDEVRDRCRARPEDSRSAVLNLLKDALKGGRDEIRRRYEDGASGTENVRATAFLMDQILRVLYDHAFEDVYPRANPTAGERLCVTAVGGYGRGELAPWSDLDLLFLHPYKATAHTEQVIEYILYMLWDLGLKVGHASRSVDDCIRRALNDMTIRTSVLEARYIWGDQKLHNELRHRFGTEVIAGSEAAFAEAKLAERDARHQRMGDSRYVLEPNIKNGKGGLRDLHTLFWIAKYIYRVDDVRDLVAKGVFTEKEAQDFAKAQNLLWTIRCHLHYLAGRPEDRLTFDLQPEIAQRMGYTDHAGTQRVERFMKRYYLTAKEVGDLTRIFCAALESEQKRERVSGLRRLITRHREVEGFPLEGGRLTVKSEAALAAAPVDILRLFHVAQAHDLDIHPTALRAITRTLDRIGPELRRDPEANQLFLEMLASRHDPATALKRMNEAGVFGKFVTDFGRVVAQMQHDMYHVYTVDEHTIRAIGILAAIEAGELKEDHPLSTDIIHKVVSRRALYVAVLLHDIAKGRGGDHSVLGAEIAERLGPRFGLSEEETENVAWLVRHHLLMNNTAQKRDINDAKTISDFAAIVQSPERLRMLLVLTVADMRATGPTVWNGWKAALLRELYWRTEEVLSGRFDDASVQSRARDVVDRLRPELSDWSEAEFDAHIARGNSTYWLGHEIATLVRHARQIRAAEQDGQAISVATHIDAARDVTEVSIYAPDHPGLFARIAGALAMSNTNIVVASVCTLTNGKALDTFWVQNQDGEAVGRDDRLPQLPRLIADSLSGKINPERALHGWERLPERAQVFTVRPRVLIDNQASATHTIIEINGRDRPGFLYDVTRTLAALNLQINTAKIATYGERAVDVFYVKDVFGMKVQHDRKLEEIRERIGAVIGDDDGSAGDAAATAEGAKIAAAE
ncbi:MAG: [protein-PII] uridylyltransferase [Alphaproteobacteria bacterium]|nr:[protein-PII] uridylyltransferase [Alphaproteobacteria bacterium]